jgi:hypothetical protein
MNNHIQLLAGNGGLYYLANNGTLVHVNKTRLNWKGTKLYYKKNTPEGNQWLPVNLPPEPGPRNRWPPTKIARGFSSVPELKHFKPTETITRSSSLPKMNARPKEGNMFNFLRNKKIPGFMKHGMKESLITSLITQKDPVAINKALKSPLIKGKHRAALNNALSKLKVNP